jgi:hypothetical protein
MLVPASGCRSPAGIEVPTGREEEMLRSSKTLIDGDVSSDHRGADQPSHRILDWRDGQRYVYPGAVLADVFGLDVFGLIGFQSLTTADALEDLTLLGLQLPGHKERDMTADRLLRGESIERSAAGFQEVMIASRSLLSTASCAPRTTAARWASELLGAVDLTNPSYCHECRAAPRSWSFGTADLGD